MKEKNQANLFKISIALSILLSSQFVAPFSHASGSGEPFFLAEALIHNAKETFKEYRKIHSQNKIVLSGLASSVADLLVRKGSEVEDTTLQASAQVSAVNRNFAGKFADAVLSVAAKMKHSAESELAERFPAQFRLAQVFGQQLGQSILQTTQLLREQGQLFIDSIFSAEILQPRDRQVFVPQPSPPLVSEEQRQIARSLFERIRQVIDIRKIFTREEIQQLEDGFANGELDEDLINLLVERISERLPEVQQVVRETVTEREVRTETATREIILDQEQLSQLQQQVDVLRQSQQSSTQSLFQTIALTNRIDSLTNVTLDSPTISGTVTLSGSPSFTGMNQFGANSASISGSVSAGSLSVSGTSSLATTTVNSTLGVGTTSPVAKLAVEGSLYVANDATIAGNLVVAGSQTLTGTQQFNGPVNASSTLQVTGASRLYSTLLADGAVNASSSLQVTGATRLYSTLFVDGNVGIGTTSPSQKLDVEGNVKISGVGNGLIFPDGTTLTTASATSTGVSNDGDVNVAADADLNGSGNIFFATNGTNRAIIANNGNFGIGTTSPTAQLSVANRLYVGGTGTSTFENNLHVLGTLQTGTGSIFLGDTFLQASNGAFALNTNATSTFGTNGLNIGSNQFVVQQTSGRVGINTDTPDARLDIEGPRGSDFIRLTDTTGPRTWGLQSNSISSFAIQDNGSTVFAISAGAGSVGIGIGDTVPNAKLRVDAPSNNRAITVGQLFTVMGDGKTSIGKDLPSATLDVLGTAVISSTLSAGTTTVTNLAVTNNSTSTFAGGVTVGTNQFVVQQATGRVGIGTANPSEELDVVGTIKAGISGSDFRVLDLSNSSSNSAAMIRWQTPSSIEWELGVQGANQFELRQPGGLSFMVFNPTGELGIGTTSPSQKLSVQGNALFSGNISAANVTATGTFTTSGLFTFGNASGTQLTTTGSTYLATTGGNVGLGTVSPSNKLSVSGSADVSTDVRSPIFRAFGSLTGGGSVSLLANPSSGGVGGSVTIAAGNGTDNSTGGSVSIQSGSAPSNGLSGNISITGANSSFSGGSISLTAGNSGVSAGAITLSAGTGPGGVIVFNTAGTERARILQTGNVGIGTTSPSQTLAVHGNTLFSGNISSVANITATGTLSLTGTSGTSTIASGQGFAVGGTQFVVNGSNGAVGIGGNPIITGVNSIGAGVRVFNTGVPVMNLIKLNGSISSPTPPTSGQTLGRYDFQGYSGQTIDPTLQGYSGRAVSVIGRAAENWTDAANGAHLTFETNPIGGIAGIAGPIERMRITSEGNIGIGTTSPSEKFSVQGNALVSGNLTVGNLTATGTVNVGNLGTTSITNLSVTNTSSSTFAGPISNTSGNLTIASTGTTNKLLLNPYGGNVGVGTDDPLEKLSVKGNLKFFHPSDGNGITRGINVTPSQVGGAGSILSYINTSGSFDFGAINGGTGVQSVFMRVTSQNTGTPENSAIALYTNTGGSSGIERMRVNGDGNVGIGTTSPSQRLSVQGSTLFSGDLFAANITATGTLNLPNSGGSAIIQNPETAVGSAISFKVGGTEAFRVVRHNVNGTNLRLDDGLTSNPALTFINDTNTGIMRGGEDLIDFVHNATARLRLGFNKLEAIDPGYQILGVVTGSSASVPAYSFSGDTNTGIFSPTADVLALTTNASEKLRIDSSGNVGIGTTSPTEQLSLSNRLYVGGTGTSTIENNLQVRGTLQTGSGSIFLGSNFLNFNQAATIGLANTTNALNFDNNTLIIDAQNNRVGIGQTQQGTVPGKTLDIAGVVRINDTGTNSTVNDALIIRKIPVTTGGGSRILFQSDTVFETILQDVASIEAVKQGGGSGSESWDLIFKTSNSGTNAERIRIKNDGKIGVGTSSPSETLSVQGNALFSGNLFVANITATGTFTTSGLFTFGNASGTQLTTTGSTYLATAGGNVGVGTANPAARVDIQGDSGSLLRVGNSSFADLLEIPSSTSGEAAIRQPLLVKAYSPSGVYGSLDVNNNNSDAAAPIARFKYDNDAFIIYGNRIHALGNALVDGNVGIGTTSPTQKLSVQGNALVSGNLTVGNLTATGTVNVGNLGTTSVTNLSVTNISTSTFGGPISSASGDLIINSVGNNVVINPYHPGNGKLGIGDASPDAILEISQQGGGTDLFMISTSADGDGNLFKMDGGGAVSIGTIKTNLQGQSTGDSRSLTISPGAGGNTNSKGTLELAGKNNSAGSVLGSIDFIRGDASFTSFDKVAGIQSYVTSAGTQAGQLSFLTQPQGGSPTERMIIDPTGSVGIGTTSPTEQLSVANRLYVGGSGTSTIENNLHVRGTVQVGTGSTYITSGSIGTSAGNFTGNIDLTNPQVNNTGYLMVSGRQIVTYNTGANALIFGQTGGTLVPTMEFRPNDALRAKLSSAGWEVTNDVFSTGGVFRGPDSSASAPLYTFTSDTNTGLFSAGADAIGITTGGSEKLRITSAGNIGIGTTTPTEQLSVANRLYVGGTGTSTIENNLQVRGTLQIGTSSIYITGTSLNLGSNSLTSSGTLSGNILSLTGTSGTSTIASGQGFTVGSTQFVVQQGSGRVGMGTADPAVALQIGVGSPSAAESGIQFGSTDTTARIYRDGSNSGVKVDSNFGVPGYLRMSKNDATVFFDNGGITTNYIGRNSSTGNVDLSSANYVHIADSTSLGIGTTSPAAKLGVNGTAMVAGKVTITNAGTNVPRLYLPGVQGVTDSAYGGIQMDFADTAVKFLMGPDDDGNNLMFRTIDAAGGFQFRTTNGGIVQTITDGGNVGIGTTSPEYRLDIQANASGNASTLRLYNPFANGNPHLRIQNDARHYSIQVAGSRNDNFEIQDSFAGSGASAVRLAIDTSGNVGIGTTTPAKSLAIQSGSPLGTYATNGALTFDIQHSATDSGVLQLYSGGVSKVSIGSNQSSYLNGGNVGIGTASPGKLLHLAGTNPTLRFKDPASVNLDIRGDGAGLDFDLDGSEKMTIQNSGNVGIGTTSPWSKLSVAGDIALFDTGHLFIGDGGNASNPMFANVLDQNTGLFWPATDMLALTTGGTERLRINSTGNVGIGTSTPDASFRLTVTGNSAGVGPGVLFTDTASSPENYAIYINGSKNLTFRDQTASVDRLTITTAGNVGIGTTTPINKLHILKGGSGVNVGTEPSLVISDTSGINALSIISGDTSTGGIRFGKSSDAARGQVRFQHAAATANERLEFVTSAGTSMAIDGNGNVGIGTTSPGVKFHVMGDASGNIARFVSGISSAATAEIQSDVSAIYFGSSGSGTDTVLRAGGLSGAEKVTIKSSGNVGIGTTSPSKTLSVFTSTNNDFGAYIHNSGGDAQGLLIQGSDGVGTNALLSVITNTGTSRFKIEEGGNVGIGLTNPSHFLNIRGTSTASQQLLLAEVSTGGDVFLVETDSGGDAKIQFAIPTAGPFFHATSANGGRIGIGTTTPGNALVVKPAVSDDGIVVREADGGADAAKISANSARGLFELWNAGTLTTQISGGSDNIFFNGGGNVSIGTTTASSKFNIHASATGDVATFLSSNGDANVYIRAKDTAVSHLVFGNESNTNFGELRVNTGAQTGGAGAVIIDAGGIGGNDLMLLNGGSLAIGGVIPSAKLHVTGASATQTVLFDTVSNTQNHESTLNFRKSSGTNQNSFAVTANGENLGRVNFQGVDTANVARSSASVYAVQSAASGADYVPADLIFGTSNSASLVQERMRITAAGNIGIGTTTPASHLTVNSGGNTSVDISAPAGGYASLAFSTDGGANWVLRRPPSTTDLRLYDGTADRVTFQNGGNVGIGTTSPAAFSGFDPRLSISSNAPQVVLHSSASNRTWFTGVASDGFLYTRDVTAGAYRMVIDTSGNVGIGTTLPGSKLEVNSGQIGVANGDATAPSYAFKDDLTTGMYRPGAGKLAFTVGNAQRIVTLDANAFTIGETGSGAPLATQVLTTTDGSGTNIAGSSLVIQGGQGTGTGSGGYISFETAAAGSTGSTPNTLSERVRITNAGNVGIGTTTPAAKLHVTDDSNDIQAIFGSGARDTVLQMGRSSSGAARLNVLQLSSALTVGPSSGVVRTDILGGGSAGISVLSGGNVGIGTTSPLRNLDVSAAGSVGAGINSIGAAGTAFLDLNSGRQYRLQATSGGLFHISDETAGQFRVTLNSSGNVGIGTTSPGTLLSLHSGSDFINFWVTSTSTLSKGINLLGGCFAINGTCVSGGGGGSGTVNNGTQGQVAFYDANGTAVSGTSTLSISTKSNVGIGTTTPLSLLSLSGPGNSILGISLGCGNTNAGCDVTSSRYIGLTNSTNNTNIGADSGFSGIEFGGPASANEGFLAFHTHDAGASSGERLRIDKSGNVGIGTTSPSKTLSVAGNAIISGTTTIGELTISNSFDSGSTTPRINTLYKENIVKAWVTFSSAVATPVIKDAFNVSSLTDNGTGDITVNWLVAFSTTNYAAIVGSGHPGLDNTNTVSYIGTSKTTTSLRTNQTQASGAADLQEVSVIAIGDQ